MTISTQPESPGLEAPRTHPPLGGGGVPTVQVIDDRFATPPVYWFQLQTRVQLDSDQAATDMRDAIAKKNATRAQEILRDHGTVASAARKRLNALVAAAFAPTRGTGGWPDLTIIQECATRSPEVWHQIDTQVLLGPSPGIAQQVTLLAAKRDAAGLCAALVSTGNVTDRDHLLHMLEAVFS